MKHIRTTLTLVVLAMLATMATADRAHNRKVKSPNTAAFSGSPSREVQPMVGTWTLRDGDRPRRDIKMVFRPNGTFAFVGPNWQSSGNFRVQDHKLDLVWTSVDGSKVAPGSIKKAYPMTPDDGSFTIDKYTYYKLSK